MKLTVIGEIKGETFHCAFCGASPEAYIDVEKTEIGDKVITSLTYPSVTCREVIHQQSVNSDNYIHPHKVLVVSLPGSGRLPKNPENLRSETRIRNHYGHHAALIFTNALILSACEQIENPGSFENYYNRVSFSKEILFYRPLLSLALMPLTNPYRYSTYKHMDEIKDLVEIAPHRSRELTKLLVDSLKQQDQDGDMQALGVAKFLVLVNLAGGIKNLYDTYKLPTFSFARTDGLPPCTHRDYSGFNGPISFSRIVFNVPPYEFSERYLNQFLNGELTELDPKFLNPTMERK